MFISPSFLNGTVDEERAGQESGVKGDNSEQVPMKVDNTSQENGLYNDDYEDDERPLVIDTSVGNGMDDDPTPEEAADNGDNENAHSINLNHNESEQTSKETSMVNTLNSNEQSAPVTYQENHRSPCWSTVPSSPGTGNTPPTCSSPSSVKPAPGRRAKKPGVLNTSPGSQNCERKFDCPVCPLTFGSSHELTKHIRSHNSVVTGTTNNNTCTICGKVLSSQSSLDRHMLVHSGERPFKCKVCKMAFTTNGNMHRHMRIHGKDGELASNEIRIGSGRKARANKNTPSKGELNVPSMVGLHTLLPFSQMNSRTYVDRCQVTRKEAPSGGHREKRQLEDSEETGHESKRRLSYNSDLRMGSPSSSQSMDDLVCQESLQQDSDKMEEALNADGDPLHCPICGKSFLCKYGMQSHLETHTSYTLRCHTCSLSFRTQNGLQMHKLIVHSNNNDNAQARVSPVSSTNGEEEVAVGFHDLNFMEFSISKFSLAAKAFCEKSPRQASSAYHHFSCKDCTKTFPCKGALKLHECGHIPEKMASCPICQCDFENAQKLHLHMIKHLSDKALAECREKADLNSSMGQDSFIKHSFLAYLDLKSTDDLSDQGEAISNIEKMQNDEYFAKLGQVYSAKMAEEKPMKQSVKKLADCPKKSAESFSAVSDMNGEHSLSPSHSQFPLSGARVGASGSPMMPGSMNYPSSIPARSPMVGQIVSTSGSSHVRMLPGLSMLHAVSLGGPPDCPSPTVASPLTDEDSGGGGGELLTHDKSTSKGMFVCKYCDKSFTNYRALKGHTRTHLGLSPYKCNLCSYSSADKSTLIRHLRTHNGERPFQCLICDFAFTTKANCERHVRKKHAKISKEDIEKSIGYNKFVSADSAKKLDATNFHSPDTICKYCGVDFKFFRALKHHLRSHSSCRQKPFLCQKCSIGFSTKANCVRHIQKQHLDVPQNLIEGFIHVNEPAGILGLLDKDGEQLSDASMENSFGSACSSPSLSMMRFGSTPTPQNGVALLSSTPSPRPAHSTPIRSLPSNHPTTMPLTVKTEPVPLTNEDVPLDFSMKPDKAVMRKPSPKPLLQTKVEVTSVTADDLPMDLSVKKEPVTKTETSVTLPKARPQAGLTNQAQCQYCPQVFRSHLALEKHIQIQHFLAKGHSSRLNKSCTSISAPLPSSRSGSAGSGSDCELASIHKMMDVTDPHQFKAFFQVPDNLDHSPIKILSRTFDKKTPNAESKKALENKQSPSESVDENCNKKSSSAEELLHSGETTPTGQAPFSFNDDEFGNDSLDNVPEEHINEVTEGHSLDGFAEGLKIDGEVGQKKKRNSYADSPHKLHCPYCSRTFPWVSSLTRHLLTHTGQKPFKCPRCPVTFSTKSNRERHLIRKHGVNMLDPASRQTMDRPFKCHLCIFSSFSTKSPLCSSLGNLLKHYHERHPGCNVPETILRGEHNLDANDLDMSEDYEGQMMETSMDLPSEPETEENYKPTEEDLAKIELVMHEEGEKMPAPQSNRPLNPERDNYNVDKITECWKCSAKFSSRKLLVRHLKEHNIDFPFKCYLCDASFETRKECLHHQERVHCEDWPQLREKNRVDDIEGFSEAMEELVAKNYRGGDPETNDMSDVVAGEEAAIDAATSDYIQRKVYCSLCPKRFWSLQDLRRHMRSHTGEKPFECDMCQKRFTLKHSMMRHRKKHFEMPESMSASDDEDSVHNEDTVIKGGEKKNLVIESVLNRLRNHQEQTIPATQHRDKKTFNGDMFLKKKLNYLQDRKSPLSSVTGREGTGGRSQDILQSLLGVEDSAIDEMLESADSAAERLGVK
ncbi:ras-responsive element-binding protein 1-like isoform X2 [Liolophura sinensis]|uniref:ras-responsive element-binding protein 1-like isoform X2 n=1 Tax=Liolophura sinensis TaxID=3198878 RepID=UPI00315804DC